MSEKIRGIKKIPVKDFLKYNKEPIKSITESSLPLNGYIEVGGEASFTEKGGYEFGNGTACDESGKPVCRIGYTGGIGTEYYWLLIKTKGGEKSE